MAEVDRLLIRIDASTELLRKELQKGTQAVEGFARKTDAQLDRVDRRFAAFGASVKRAFGTIAGAFGVGLSLQGLRSFTTAALAAGDEIAKIARAADIAGERFQRLRYVFGLGGIETDQFNKAMQRLNSGLGQFIATGGGPALQAIKALGLETKIASGEIRTGEQFFDAFAEGIRKVGSEAEAAGLAALVFGERVGPKMVATLRQSAEALKAAEDAAKGVFSEQQLRDAEALTDAFTRMAQTVGVALKGAFLDAAGAVARFFEVSEAFNTVDLIEQRLTVLRSELEALDNLRGRNARNAAERGAQLREEIALLEQRKQSLATQGLTGVEVTATPRRLDPFVGPPGRAAPGLEEVDTSQFVKRLGPLKQATTEAADAASEFGTAFAAAFESRGIEALLEGDLSSALRGFTKDILELILRLTVLRPLAESLEGLFSGGGKLFGGGRQAGGPVTAGSAYLVGESGPELFVPRAAGQIVGHRAAFAGGGVVVNVPINVQAGLPPQWASQLAIATETAAASAYEAVTSRLGGRR